VKGALAHASPLPFLAIRFTLAAMLLVLVPGRPPFDRRSLVPGVILGWFLFGGYAFQTWGLSGTTPSKCAFITGFSVILVPMFMLLRGARMRASNLAGALLGLAGIYLLVLPSGPGAVNRGDVLTLVGACSFAIHIVLVGVYTRQFAFQHLVLVQILAVGVFAALGLPFDETVTLDWTPGLAGAILVTSVLATGFAFSVQNWAQRYTPPAHTALIFALEPVFAALTSFAVLHEKIGAAAFLGCALILAGMIVSERWGGTSPTPVEG
jgi:drug/metabolite transporter (DMT)-like permease